VFEGQTCSLPMKIRILTRLATGNSQLSNLLGKERHCVAESFKWPDRTVCQPSAISLLEIVNSQIAVRLLGREHVIDDHQKAVGNRYYSFVLANPARKAGVLDGKIVIFPMPEHPDHFCQHGP
jgi:hypothetical protein